MAVALSAATVLSYAPRANAGNKVLAEELFRAGHQLMNDKKYDEACAKFDASEKEEASAGTLVNLAHCHELIGRTASAWAEYKQAAVMARDANRPEVEQAARDFSAKLEPTLSKLQIDAPAIPGLVVQTDSDIVEPAAFALPLAVDPGLHTIEAKAPGYKPWSIKITVGKAGDVQKVTVPALEHLPDEVKTGPDAGPSTAQSNATRRTAGFVVAGVGAAGVIVGAITGVLALSKTSSTKNDTTLCSANGFCNASGADALSSASTLAHVSTIGIIGGGVALAVGAVLIVTSAPPKKKDAAMKLIPSVGPQGGGLSFAGSF